MSIRVISYYKVFKKDVTLLKAIVGICFTLDTICTAANDLGGKWPSTHITPYLTALSVPVYNYSLG